MERILVVDRSDMVVARMTMILSDPAREIHSFVDAQKALHALEREGWDLVIASARMPGVDGSVFCRLASEMYPAVPCILMSSCGSTEELLSSLEANSYAFLQKPVEEAYLDSLVKSALRLSTRRRHGVIRHVS